MFYVIVIILKYHKMNFLDIVNPIFIISNNDMQ